MEAFKEELRLTNEAHNEKVILYETKIIDLAILREELEFKNKEIEGALKLAKEAHYEEVMVYEAKIADLAKFREDLVKANEETIQFKEELNIVRQEKENLINQLEIERNELVVCKENLRLAHEAHHEKVTTYEAKIGDLEKFREELENATKEKVRFKEELDNMRKEKENLIGQLGGNTKLEGRDEKMKQVRVLGNVKNECGVINGGKSNVRIKALREESLVKDKVSKIVCLF